MAYSVQKCQTVEFEPVIASGEMRSDWLPVGDRQRIGVGDHLQEVKPAALMFFRKVLYRLCGVSDVGLEFGMHHFMKYDVKLC